jgi:methionine aminotransferase
MQNLQSRLPDVGTSIFSVMSKMALEHGAINLSQGFPDFNIDKKLIDLVYQFMLQGYNQYAPMPGVQALREVISTVIERTYNRKTNSETEVTITAGATEAIYSSIAAFISSGDEVIIFDPSYDSYDPAIRLNGGVPVRINLNFPDFSIDWDLVQKKISAKTKMILINSPHNPSGALLSEDDLRQLERIALRHNLIVLSDEVYERLIYDNHKHHSVLGFPGLAANSICAFSFGKTFHATGWKCGYIVAPDHLTREIKKVHQFNVFSVNTPMQWALSEYMKDALHYKNLGSFYQKKRDFFLQQIKGSSFEPLPSKGSYFQLLSYRNIKDKPDVAMAEDLTRNSKIASIPVSVFYKDRTDNHILRFCFAKQDETLEKAGEILRKL